MTAIIITGMICLTIVYTIKIMADVDTKGGK